MITICQIWRQLVVLPSHTRDNVMNTNGLNRTIFPTFFSSMGGWLVDSDFFSSLSSHLPPPPPLVTEEWFSSTYITCQLARCQRKQRVMSFRYRFRFIFFIGKEYNLFIFSFFFSVLYGTVIHEPIVFLSVLDFSCLISFTFLFSMYAYKKSCCICLFVQGENYSVFFFLSRNCLFTAFALLYLVRYCTGCVCLGFNFSFSFFALNLYPSILPFRCLIALSSVQSRCTESCYLPSFSFFCCRWFILPRLIYLTSNPRLVLFSYRLPFHILLVMVIRKKG